MEGLKACQNRPCMKQTWVMPLPLVLLQNFQGREEKCTDLARVPLANQQLLMYLVHVLVVDLK